MKTLSLIQMHELGSRVKFVWQKDSQAVKAGGIVNLRVHEEGFWLFLQRIVDSYWRTVDWGR